MDFDLTKGHTRVNNGNGSSAVPIKDGGNSITVDAVELDIRDLDYTTDSVEIGALASDISTNSNTQLNTTTYDSSGNEGQTIIGAQWIDGNSGVDKSTNTIQTIEYEHHEIHSGSHYYYCDYALNQSASAVVEFIVTTPDTAAWPHLVFAMTASEGATLEFYVAPTGITGGTTVDIRNNNANSTNTTGLTILKDPSAITDDGTRIAGYLAGGGKTAGITSRSNEVILAQDFVYLVRISSLAVSNDISWCAEWYEHVNKN